MGAALYAQVDLETRTTEELVVQVFRKVAALASAGTRDALLKASLMLEQLEVALAPGNEASDQLARRYQLVRAKLLRATVSDTAKPEAARAAQELSDHWLGVRSVLTA